MKRFHARMMMMALVVLGGLLVTSPAAPAADTLAEVKVRMEQRLPQVVALKAAGVVGENNAGLLTVLGAATDADTAAVVAENSDRQTVYAAIAAKTGTTPASVGARRAKQIAESAPAGTKIQDEKGQWTTK